MLKLLLWQLDSDCSLKTMSVLALRRILHAPRRVLLGQMGHVLGRQCFSERSQQLRSVTTPGTAVHACQSSGFRGSQPLKRSMRVFRMREVIHAVPEGFTGPKNVGLCEGLKMAAALLEQIDA
jgi:hypothetical protein